MVVGVLFGSVRVMLACMQRMAMRNLGMVRRFFMVPGMRMLRCFAMMMCGLLVMICGLVVVVVNGVLGHLKSSLFVIGNDYQ